MASMLKPELGDLFPLGTDNIYVVEVEDDYDGRTVVTGHDANGDEIEVRAHMLDREDFEKEMGYEPDGYKNVGVY